MLVTAFATYEDAAARLADALERPFRLTQLHIFPDGEHRVILPQPLADHLVVCCSLYHPNDKLIDLLLLAGTARELGVKKLTLVAPYLCYMRQDVAFHAGEAVSQRIIGRLLADTFDEVISVDPHLHRTGNFSDAVPAQRAVALKATEAMAAYLKQGDDAGALLIGPDEESGQWVGEIAAISGCEFGVAKKSRRGDRDVSIELPDVAIRGREVVLIDDMISTGHTLAETAKLLHRAGALSVAAVVTHALLTRDAEQQLREAGINRLVTSDSVPHSSNRIWLADILASAVTEGENMTIELDKL